MSCCPAAPKITVGGSVGSPNAGQESDIQKGESVECYAARAGDQTGKMDDATDLAQDKIENTSIPIKSSNVSVDVTFRLTSNSTKTASYWKLKLAGAYSLSIGPVNFTGSSSTDSGNLKAIGTTSTLQGTFSSSQYDQPFEVLIEVYDNTDELIDARTFKFSPSKATETNSIKLILPLPGAIVNSKFGPRKHPITGIMKLHSGIDLKMADRSTVDVVAAADGEVIFAGVNGTLTSGYGNCIKIQHKAGNGSILCSTLYGHLAKIYVAAGQRVAAGQKIGHEGTTGSSTGNHLHFECRLPNNTPVDPVPYFKGGVSVSDQTTAEGDPSGSVAPPQDSGATLTNSEVSARSSSCPQSGTDPLSGAAAPSPSPAPPPVAGDAFEHAWYFTMTFEVGPHWMSQPQYSPGDSDIDNGRIETDLQRKKVGYKPGPNFPGGETKFGVAQNPNKSKVVVNTLKYAEAKTFGRTNYWEISGTTKCSNKAPLIGVLLFDINYLHGSGNAKTILANSGQAGVLSSASQAEQIAACEALTQSCLNFISGLNPTYQAGWKRRTTDRLAYVKSLPYPLQ